MTITERPGPDQPADPRDDLPRDNLPREDLGLPGADAPADDFKLPRVGEPDPRMPGPDGDLKPDVEIPDSHM